mmetsp:Transcript_21028/g.45871  ORF Transcript_21028/g.45871 Transcript_21028/m.45871 type:complete len:298 (-) Transcript_21028:310-1203(-)
MVRGLCIGRSIGRSIGGLRSLVVTLPRMKPRPGRVLKVLADAVLHQRLARTGTAASRRQEVLARHSGMVAGVVAVAIAIAVGANLRAIRGGGGGRGAGAGARRPRLLGGFRVVLGPTIGARAPHRGLLTGNGIGVLGLTIGAPHRGLRIGRSKSGTTAAAARDAAAVAVAAAAAVVAPNVAVVRFLYAVAGIVGAIRVHDARVGRSGDRIRAKRRRRLIAAAGITGIGRYYAASVADGCTDGEPEVSSAVLFVVVLVLVEDIVLVVVVEDIVVVVEDIVLVVEDIVLVLVPVLAAFG